MSSTADASSRPPEPDPSVTAAGDDSDHGSGDDPSRRERVAAAVQGWQHELAEVGGPNTLLWHRDVPGGTLDLTTAHPGGVAMLLAGRPTRLSDLVREPAARGGARERVRAIRHQAVELWEEHGLAAGYIAVGMATWRAPHAARPPAAPVLLRSCALRPTSAAELDFDVDLGADVEFNPVLLHYLRSERGVEIDGEELADRAMVRKGFDPHPVYAELSRACHRIPGFRISPRLVVGTFSHAKLPMVADLAAHGDTLAQHDVVAALAGDPDAAAAVGTAPPPWPDDPDPSSELAVLDLDAAQQGAVEAVRAGADLVVEGAPGTGKTQAIAGMVAALAADGRTVLLVSEKRAAIEAAARRLDGIGLGDLVLVDPGDPRARRRLSVGLAEAVAGQRLDHAPAKANADDQPEPEDVDEVARLVERRDELVAHLASLHGAREPWGVSAFDAQVALAEFTIRPEAPVSRVRVEGADLDQLTRERVAVLGGRLTEAAELGAWSGTDDEDPWYASRFTSDEEAARALDITKRLSGGELAKARRQMDELTNEAGLPAPTTCTEWAGRLELMERVRDSHEVFRLEVFDAPLGELVPATASRDQRRRDADLGFVARTRLTRQARALLRPGPPPADLHGELEAALRERDEWRELAGSGARPEAPAGVEASRVAFTPVQSDLMWLGERLEDTAVGNDLVDLPLDRLGDRLRSLTASADRLEIVPRVLAALDEAREAGLGPVVDDLARRRVPAARVTAELEFVWWASVLARIAATDPRYGEHDGDRLREVAADYVRADHAHLASTVRRVRAQASERVARAVADHPGQVDALRDEAARTSGLRGWRDLLPAATDVLTALRPCWSMSPLAVASLLPEGRLFDVVVFDEAGTVPVAHAVSAIARARQVVAVGDPLQLAPVPFATVAGESAPDESEPGGSLLAALALLAPQIRLDRHYGSCDERLVAFAARQVYGDRLVTFPGTLGPDVLSLLPASEPADLPPAGGEVGASWADDVARAAIEHARTRPGETLGVVTIDRSGAAEVEGALARRLAQAPEVGGYFRPDATERFFVKPIGLAQGDARDAVLLVLERPAHLDEAQLAVATTRARRRMTVLVPAVWTAVDSRAGAAVPTTGDRAGARAPSLDRPLAEFLQSAAASGDVPLGSNDGEQPADIAGRPEKGAATDEHARRRRTAAAETPTGEAAGAGDVHVIHPVVSDLAARLRGEGFVVHEDHGRSARRVDLAIEDPARPGHLLVALETDGPSRAAVVSTRDRERIEVEQLERLGWHHVRVWTTDVFRDPARAVAMVTAEVWAASRATAERLADARSRDGGARR